MHGLRPRLDALGLSLVAPRARPLARPIPILATMRAPAILLSLALLPSWAHAEEPFVTKPSLRARALLYGLPMAADATTTLWARSRGAVELNPALQDPAVMMASRVALGAFLAWLDGKLPRPLQWLMRAATVGWGAYHGISNLRAGKNTRR